MPAAAPFSQRRRSHVRTHHPGSAAARLGRGRPAWSAAARFWIQTTIVVPGSFTSGTNHFTNAGSADDAEVAALYEVEYSGLMDQISFRLADLAPADQDPMEVARQIVTVVHTPKGARPFRVHVDPAAAGAEVVNAVGDRVRSEFYRRVGLEDLLHPAN